MSTSRKCTKCNSWNTDNNYCPQCGELLNYEMQQQKIQEDQKLRFENRHRDKIEAYIEKLRLSKSFFGRIQYLIYQSLWALLIAIISFIYAIIAFIAG